MPSSNGESGNPAAERELAPRERGPYLFNRAVVAYDMMRAQWKRATGLNSNERQAVAHLWESGPLTMGEVGDRLGLSRAAMTSLVDRLVADGFLEREPDVVDRRRTNLRVTGKAERILGPLAEPWTTELVAHFAQMSDDEWRGVVRFLELMYDKTFEHASRYARLDDEELRSLAGRHSP